MFVTSNVYLNIMCLHYIACGFELLHNPFNLAKIPPNQVIADFGRGSSVESESE